jgi:hypothetical protein
VALQHLSDFDGKARFADARCAGKCDQAYFLLL